jgi:hypothetical protein
MTVALILGWVLVGLFVALIGFVELRRRRLSPTDRQPRSAIGTFVDRSINLGLQLAFGVLASTHESWALTALFLFFAITTWSAVPFVLLARRRRRAATDRQDQATAEPRIGSE